MNIINAHEYKNIKSRLVKMANEDPENLKRVVNTQPKDVQRDLDYLVRIADEAIQRAAKLRAKGLFTT